MNLDKLNQALDIFKSAQIESVTDSPQDLLDQIWTRTMILQETCEILNLACLDSKAITTAFPSSAHILIRNLRETGWKRHIAYNPHAIDLNKSLTNMTMVFPHAKSEVTRMHAKRCQLAAAQLSILPTTPETLDQLPWKPLNRPQATPINPIAVLQNDFTISSWGNNRETPLSGTIFIAMMFVAFLESKTNLPVITLQTDTHREWDSASQAILKHTKLEHKHYTNLVHLSKVRAMQFPIDAPAFTNTD